LAAKSVFQRWHDKNANRELMKVDMFIKALTA
jgi:hypothetical protein